MKWYKVSFSVVCKAQTGQTTGVLAKKVVRRQRLTDAQRSRVSMEGVDIELIGENLKLVETKDGKLEVK